MFKLSRLATPAAALLVASSALAQSPGMDALWPNDDGMSWDYAQHYENFEKPQVVDNRTRLSFTGTTVAPNGIQAQYLHQELISGPSTANAFNSDLPDPFLRTLWVARPDLRGRILQALDDLPCPQFAPPASFGNLLTGELAFRKAPDEIAAWRCNLPDTKSWMWLVSDLTIGNRFTLQLVPDLADDVFLHGTIAAIEDVTVPAGTFLSCVRVDYVIDYGTGECSDYGGDPTGSYRSQSAGRVHYAPGVGPVASYEEFVPFAEIKGECGSIEVGFVAWLASLQMESSTTPVRRSTWGQLKATYR